MKNFIHSYSQQGQALVVLLVFMMISIVITSMAVSLVIINSTAASETEQGEMAVKIAESGIENALIRLIRNPSYTVTETLTLDDGTVTATISGSNPIIIVSRGTVGNFVRSASVSAQFIDTVLTIHSWQEVY